MEENVNADENFHSKETNERKSNEKVSSVVKVEKVPPSNKNKQVGRMILYLIDKDDNKKGSKRNSKKLGASSSGNIFNDKEKRFYKKIDLRTAGIKAKQPGVSKRKSSKPQSNSRGNAFKYKQSSNKKNKSKLDRDFRSQTRKEVYSTKGCVNNPKMELFKTEKHCEEDDQGKK